MKKILMLLGVVTALSGCGEVVPPASKGKILSSSGYSADVRGAIVWSVRKGMSVQ